MEFTKTRLTKETKIYLEDELDNVVTKDLKAKIELFDKYLCISKAGTLYDGLNDRISNGLNDWTNGKQIRRVLNSLSITEQYLSSLVNLLDESEYKKIIGNGQEFRSIIILIGMTKLSNNGNLNLKLSEREEMQGMTLERKYKDDTNQYHWANAYSFRNEDAHTSKKYDTKEMLGCIYSILYVLLESTWKYKAKIESLYTNEFIFTGINKDGYFSKITKEFESKNLQKTFIVMSVISESNKRTELNRNNDEDEDDNESEKKTNLISSLDIMKATDNKGLYIKLVGEAGLGKSRLMKYLQYKDAKEGITYPVYIELREWSGSNRSLMELIAEKAGLGIEACELLMQEGGLSLYLDGINEVLCTDNEKRIICGEINDLTKKYPRIKMLVSDRENSYITVKDMPIYLLVKLDKPLVHDFILKNSQSKEVEDKIKNILEEEKYLYDIIKTPFMVEAFISLVENNEYTTSIKNKSKLKAKFVESLIRREAEEKLEGRASKIKFLLTHLFIKGKDWDDEIRSFTERDIVFRFSKCMEYYRFEADTIEILELIVQMGILVKSPNNDQYTFANEIYESYFKDEAFDTILELQ